MMSWKYEDDPRPELLPKLCDINDIEWLNENEKNDSSNTISLHNELIKFYNYIRLTKEEIYAREELINSLKSLVNNRWPQATINCFGSYQLYLSNFTSDVDISISGLVDNNIDCEWYIDTTGDKNIHNGINNHTINSNVPTYLHINDRQVFDSLDNDDDDAKKRQVTYYLNILYLKDIKNKDFVLRSEFRPKARVPIINFTTTDAIECDISVGINKSNTNDVVYKIQSYKDITLFNVISNFLKLFLFLNDLNKPFHGGIGSFKLYMMIGQILTHKDIERYVHSDYGMVLIYFFNFYRQWRNFNRDTTITLFNVTIDFRISQKVETCRKLFDRCWYLLDKSIRPTNRTFHRAKTNSHLAMLLDVQILKYNRNISLSNLQLSKRAANKVDNSLDSKTESKAIKEIVKTNDKDINIESKIASSTNKLVQKQLELIKNREIYSQIDSQLNEVVDMQVDTFVQSSNQSEDYQNKLNNSNNLLNKILNRQLDNRVNINPGVVVQQVNQPIYKPIEKQIAKQVDKPIDQSDCQPDKQLNKDLVKSIDNHSVVYDLDKQIDSRLVKPLAVETQTKLKTNKPNDKTVITNTTNHSTTTNLNPSINKSNYIANYSPNYNSNYSTNYVTNYVPICPTNYIPNYSPVYTPYYPSNYQSNQYNSASNYSVIYPNTNYPIANSLSNNLTNHQHNHIATFPTNNSINISTNNSNTDRDTHLINKQPFNSQSNQSNVHTTSITNLSIKPLSSNLGNINSLNAQEITNSSNKVPNTHIEHLNKTTFFISSNNLSTHQITNASKAASPIINILPYTTTNWTKNQKHTASQTTQSSNNCTSANQTTNVINTQAELQNKNLESINHNYLNSNLSTNTTANIYSIQFTNNTTNNPIKIQNSNTSYNQSINPTVNSNDNLTNNTIIKSTNNISENIKGKLSSNQTVSNNINSKLSNINPNKDLANFHSINSQTVQEDKITKADNDNNTMTSINEINQQMSIISSQSSNNQLFKSIDFNRINVEVKKSSELSADISANSSKILSTFVTTTKTPNTLVSNSQANNSSPNLTNNSNTKIPIRSQSIKDLYNNKNNQQSIPRSSNQSHTQSNNATIELSKKHLYKLTPDSIRRYLEELQQSPGDINNELYKQWVDYIKKVKKLKQKEFPQLSDYDIKFKAFEYIDKHDNRFSLYDTIDKKVQAKLDKDIYNRHDSKMDIQVDNILNSQKNNQIEKVEDKPHENNLVKDVYNQIKPTKRINDNELYTTNKKTKLEVEIEDGELVCDVDIVIPNQIKNNNQIDNLISKSNVTKVDNATIRKIGNNAIYRGSSDSKIVSEIDNNVDNLSNKNVGDDMFNILDNNLICKIGSEKVNKLNNRSILNDTANIVDSTIDVNTNIKIVNHLSNITNSSVVKNTNSINGSIDRQRYNVDDCLEDICIDNNISSSMKLIDSNKCNNSYLDSYTRNNDTLEDNSVFDSYIKEELISYYLVNNVDSINRYIKNKVKNQWHRYTNNLKLSVSQNKATYLTSYPNMTAKQIFKQVIEYALRNFHQLDIKKVIITKVRRLVVKWIDKQVDILLSKRIDSHLCSNKDIHLIDQLNTQTDKYKDIQIDSPIDKQVDNQINSHLNNQIDNYLVIDKYINSAISEYINDQLISQSLTDNKLKEIHLLNDLIKLNKKQNKLLQNLIVIKRSL